MIQTLNSNATKAIANTLIAVFLISVVDLCVKVVSWQQSIIQIVFFRNLFGIFWLLSLSWKDFSILKTNRLGEHFLRSLIVLASNYLLFYSLSILPLTTVYSISFCSPLFVTILAQLIFKEKANFYSWIAVVAGLIGVLIVLRPGTEAFDIKSLIPLLQVVLFSIGLIFIKHLATTDSDSAIIFYPTLFNTIACSFIVPFYWNSLTSLNLSLLVGIGLFASIALLLKANSYRLAPFSLVMPFEYTSIIWVSLYDYLLGNKILDNFMIIGLVIIILNNGYLLVNQRKK